MKQTSLTLRNNLVSLLPLYLFFFYFSGIHHIALQLTDSTIFIGFRQAVYMSLLWLIPPLLFPQKTKLISGLIGIMLWATSLVSIGYFCIYQNEFSHSVLYIALESNIAESSEYLEQYLKWWMLPIFLLHTVIAFWLWSRLQPVYMAGKTKSVICVFILMLLFIFPVTKDYFIKGDTWVATIDKLQKRMEPAEPWQLVMGYMQYRKQLAEMQTLLEENRKVPPLTNLHDKHSDLSATLVLVIGESTNRQHMSLYGYTRKSTPNLDAIQNELTVFDNVVSSLPATIESLQQVLTFADQQNPDLFLTKPSLMNMMKQAGYKTFWITNQQTMSKRNTMLTNFSKQMDVQHYMNHSRNQNTREYDSNVFKPFDEALKDEAKRKFIIVHLLGTHMKYKYRFPPEFERFKNEIGISKGLVNVINDGQLQEINDYDNAVLFNDYVVSRLKLKLDNGAKRGLMVYLSDHGEDVYDTPPHNFIGRNVDKPTLPMYAVPLLIWLSPEWQKTTPLNLTSFADRPYSLEHFIHTWSDLVGLTYDGFDPSKSLINEEYKTHPLIIGFKKEKKNVEWLYQ